MDDQLEADGDRGGDGDGAINRFTPTNPCLRGILGLFLDEKTADVVFDVDSKEKFHAHRLILRACAPALDEYCDGAEDVKSVSITGVEPEIFRHLLRYVYGGTVDSEVLRKHSKDIINAADRFGIGSLKVEAEGYYVESTPITLDNFGENLHFSDTKKCSLLKERVMDFLVLNETAAIQKLSKQDVPQSETMLTDFLTASARKNHKRKNSWDLSTMPVSQMRKLLDEKGLDVDGTREMLTRDIEKYCSAGNSAVLVSGAGTQEINGMYTRTGSFAGAPEYTKHAMYQGRDETFTLYRYYRCPDGWSRWYISMRGTDDDIDFYVSPLCNEVVGVIPPTTGWFVESDGLAPAPSVCVKPSENSE